MRKADRNDEWGIKNYGVVEWNKRCDYEDDKESRKERLFAEAMKSERIGELFTLINNLFGEDLQFTYTVNKEKQRIGIKSGVDLSDRPLICLAWKKFCVESFGGGIGCEEPYCSKDRDYSKPVEKVYYWMEIQYGYIHIDGGSNGASIATAYFSEDGKWTLKSDREWYVKGGRK